MNKLSKRAKSSSFVPWNKGNAIKVYPSNNEALDKFYRNLTD